MFKFFKRNKQKQERKVIDFDIELTASILAYEIAKSDGNISESELLLILEEVKKISSKIGKSEEKILKIIEKHNKESISFHEFIYDINRDYSKDEKLELIQFLYDVAYADKILEVNEERLVRRIANLIKIKDIEVLRIKDKSKNKSNSNNL
jgi:uncharacterized tellurite resistance protein B-like protein